MGTFAATGYTTWFGGYDMTTDLSELKLDLDLDALEDSRFGQTGKTRAAGLEDVKTALTGYFEAGVGKVDPEVFTGLGSTMQPVSHSADGAESSVAYFYQSKKYAYTLGGKVGELLPFKLDAQGVRGNGTLSAGAIRGRVAKAKADVSATGATGTGQQLGAVASGQYLYAVLHTFAVGTTITVVLESDDDAGFASATTRATLGPITTVGGTWATRVAGPITDDWFRFRISAITGTHTIAGVVGVK